jgi:hypothetical protein
VNEAHYITIFNISDTMSQVELNKAIIQRYFEAYNSKNEAIFDEIISPDYNSLDKFDDINYIIEAISKAAHSLDHNKAQQHRSASWVPLIVKVHAAFVRGIYT